MAKLALEQRFQCRLSDRMANRGKFPFVRPSIARLGLEGNSQDAGLMAWPLRNMPMARAQAMAGANQWRNSYCGSRGAVNRRDSSPAEGRRGFQPINVFSSSFIFLSFQTKANFLYPITI